MANNHGGRTCLKCGTPLGQKNLCPICDRQSLKNNLENNSAEPDQETKDYIVILIDFVKENMANWDDEFVPFFEKFDSPLSMKNCHRACSLLQELLAADPPEKISGSVLIRTMDRIQEVFPEISDDRAMKLSTELLKYRPAADGQDIVSVPPPDSGEMPLTISISGNIDPLDTVQVVSETSAAPAVSASRRNVDVMSTPVGQTVKKIIVKQLGVAGDMVTEDTRFVEDLYADSLDLVELAMAFEEEFSSDIPDGEAERLKTVGDVVRYILNRMGQ